MKFLIILLLSTISCNLFGNAHFKYSVARNDTIKSIAEQFQVDADRIISKNSLEEYKYLYVGQFLDIPVSYNYKAPLTCSLTEVMNNSITNWRNPVFELYSWDKSSKVLIFDTINYSYQSLMFKRLAFFVEKKDFIGSIYSLDELENEKGWNGHDYKADDLANFFNKVNLEGYSITRGEEILLDIIIKNGLLTFTKSGYKAHGGAVISCSRSSFYNHRKTILRHEAFHGLFFTSKVFRTLAYDVWNRMDYQSKSIWKMYLEVLDYNTLDKELLVNEFMAYMLQLSEDETYKYIVEIVWYRLWEYFPEKRVQINRFFNADKTPFSRQIKEFKIYTTKLHIE